VASLIQKNLAMASYGCHAGTGRNDAAEGGEKRCNTRSTIEISKYISCNIHLKAVENFKHTSEILEKNT
jgi:hypothetical protein